MKLECPSCRKLPVPIGDAVRHDLGVMPGREPQDLALEYRAHTGGHVGRAVIHPLLDDCAAFQIRWVQIGAAVLAGEISDDGITFAQDEASCVVYGMPRAAWENNAAQRQISLGDIASTISHHRVSAGNAAQLTAQLP